MAYVSLCKDININFPFASCIIGHFSFHNISCTKTNPGTKILNTKISKRTNSHRESAVSCVCSAKAYTPQCAQCHKLLYRSGIARSAHPLQLHGAITVGKQCLNYL